MTIRVGTHQRRPFVSIDDTGSGLTPAVADQLFTPFFTTKENGQGLGLTVVREILSRHGFEFSLSTTAGGPTCFRIGFGN